MEQPTVVTVDRWSLHRGALVSLRWPMEQPTVVSVDRHLVLVHALVYGLQNRFPSVNTCVCHKYCLYNMIHSHECVLV